VRSGKERIASIADSTVLINAGIGVPRVRIGLLKCVAIIALLENTGIGLCRDVTGPEEKAIEEAKRSLCVELRLVFKSRALFCGGF